ncbi:50S ribosomal protein L31 [Salmonella enterica subsp. enterica]|nr:50S ribosomal protein L31 [Salmonella enterica subsp. enterica]
MSGVRAGRATRPYTEVPHEKGIHPNYVEITATCSAVMLSKPTPTVGHDLNLDVCGKCHPFFTGKQRVVDTGGRAERFNKRQHPRSK